MRGEIVTATREHAIAVAARQRTLDCQEIRVRMNLSPEAYALRSLDRSTHAWAGLVDGHAICVFGLMAASIMSECATPWIFTTPDVERFRVTFWRGSKQVVRMMGSLYPRLEGMCDSRFEATVRWIARMGFEVTKAPEMVEGVPFLRFGMNRNA